MDQLERTVDEVRLALVAVVSVVTDEQLASVNTALEAVVPLSNRSQAALEELAEARAWHGGSSDDDPDGRGRPRGDRWRSTSRADASPGGSRRGPGLRPSDRDQPTGGLRQRAP